MGECYCKECEGPHPEPEDYAKMLAEENKRLLVENERLRELLAKNTEEWARAAVAVAAQELRISHLESQLDCGGEEHGEERGLCSACQLKLVRAERIGNEVNDG